MSTKTAYLSFQPLTFKRLKQESWYDTGSNYLRLEFKSDGSQTKKGFKFDVLCRDDKQEKTVWPKMASLTNEEVYQLAFHQGWSKEVICVNPHETVSFRLMTELISDESFDETINEIFQLSFSTEVATLNSSTTNWVDTKSKKILAMYIPNLKSDQEGSGRSYVFHCFSLR